MKKKKYNILGVITARGGSKGIPRKNIKLLGGQPLIAYSIESAKESKLITHLIVSTDDQEIANIAKKYGGSVPFLRPKKLSDDKASHLEVMQHAIRFMEKKIGIIFDYAVVLQPTSPFKNADDIDNTIRKLILSKRAQSSVSVIEIEPDSHPIKMKKIKNGRVIPYCIKEAEGLRRQDIPVAYKRSCDVYVAKRDLIIKRNKLLGDYVTSYIISKERSIDINNEFDWLKAEYLLKKNKINK